MDREPEPNKTARQLANGKWSMQDSFNGYNVHAVSADGRTFVGTKISGNSANSTRRAAVWTEETETIIPIPPGFDAYFEVDMEALAVTGDGSTVVGYANVVYSAEDQSFNDYIAFMWTAAEGARTIENVAKALKIKWEDGVWELNQATAISTDGRYVAGWGDLDDSNYEPWLLALGPSTDIVVNSITDRPRSASATSCETGEFIANGDRECTLRSAIETVNAGKGKKNHVEDTGQCGAADHAHQETPSIHRAGHDRWHHAEGEMGGDRWRRWGLPGTRDLRR